MKAAERLPRERMGVHRAAPHMYEVTNSGAFTSRGSQI